MRLARSVTRAGTATPSVRLDGADRLLVVGDDEPDPPARAGRQLGRDAPDVVADAHGAHAPVAGADALLDLDPPAAHEPPVERRDAPADEHGVPDATVDVVGALRARP